MSTAFNTRFRDANSKQKLSYKPSNALVAFKCRLMALVLNNTKLNQAQQDKFIRGCTLNGRNPLAKQASGERAGFNDGIHSPMTRDDMSSLKRNDDGYGTVGYSNGKIIVNKKAPKSALDDECFKNAIDDIASSQSEIVFAHLRQTLDPLSVNIYNTHPFTYKNWTFMHNGNIDFSNNQYFETKLNEYSQKYNLQLKGTTDSEKVFMLFLGKLKDRKIDIDNNTDITIDVLKSTFANLVTEIIAKTPKSTAAIQNKWLDGEVEITPTANFIITNGKHVMAFRHGPNLFVGRYQLNDGKNDYIISSEMVQPKGEARIRWADVENDNIITISKDDGGNFLKPVLTPLNSILLKQAAFR